jgi:hypothetical protein
MEEDVEAELEEIDESPHDKQVQSVPWYLQVEAPPGVQQPLSERQQIPDLPESPPPILEPLLQQISVDLGLDSLSLLDLRKLDPPPALGANLLMIIATARSEKHLQVSADRLCRWLRSTYKLRPDADGLLGRNELKLKLRRKAKRAKLIGSSDETGDDGVRTGWVCIDVGVVDGAEEETNAVSELKNFVGFGRRTDGVRIVVQMLTEKKREQIDLEKLWGGILERGARQEPETAERAIVDESSSNRTLQYRPLGSDLTQPSNASTTGLSSTSAQRREFHTTARRLSSEPEIRPTETDLPFGTIRNDRFGLGDVQKSTMASIVSGNFEKARSDIIQASNYIPALQNEGWRSVLLEQLRMHLERLPKYRALEELGNGYSDLNSTPFLACFHQTMSTFLSQDEAEARIWLHCHARRLQHPHYNLFGLLDLFRELQGYGVKISQDSYEQLVRAALRPAPGQSNYHGPSRYAVEGAMEILQAMHDQGMQILKEELFVDLQEAVSPGVFDDAPAHTIYTDSSDTFDLPSLPMSPIQRRLHVLMNALDLPCFSDESRSRLMDTYGSQHNWLEFWDIWRMCPRRGMPQSAEMYALMFGMVARIGNQKACMSVLRTWIPDLEREEPAVKLQGLVAESVKACLKVADPYVEQDAIDAPDMKGEWLSLWRKCFRE